MESFVPPSIWIPVPLVTTYAVAAAVLLHVVGFVIATYHYSKLGVSPGLVPLPRIWAAGMSFALMTGFFAHIGFASYHLLRSPRPGEAFVYTTLALALILLISAFLLRRAGIFTYAWGTIFLGWAIANPKLRLAPLVPSVSSESVAFEWPAVGLVAGLAVVWAFAVMVYPNVAGSLGGAAAHPVRLALADGNYGEVIAPGSEVYEVLATETSFFLEVVLPKGAPYQDRVDMFWHRQFDPPARYVQIPRSAVKYIEYTDTFRAAPQVESVAPACEPKQSDTTGRTAAPSSVTSGSKDDGVTTSP